MTENECIENLNILICRWENDENMYSDTSGIEIDQEFMNCIYKSIETLKEIQQYRAIGTVEECREARGMMAPKIPNIWGDGHDRDGNIIYDMYDCPNCGKSYEIDYSDYKHCPECGQAIDRSGMHD